MNLSLVNGLTKLYGIVGNPVGHSFSPEMQTLAFRHLDINAVYLPFPIQKNDIPKLLEAFRITGIQGFNVTVPYKVQIIEYLTELSPEARLVGSVNTVKRTENGWKGFCTDSSGFVRSLAFRKVDIKSQKILLVGAGGAAKAISFSLADKGIARLDLLNRTEKRAHDLKASLNKFNPDLPINVNPSENETYDLLINTTSVGMEGNDMPVSLDRLKRSNMVIDIVYNPPKTELLLCADRLKIPNFNGIEMLLFQGIEAFEIWTGKNAPIEVMRKSLKKSLAFT